MENVSLTRCRGHVCFITRPNSSWPWEYFIDHETGDLYRAPSDSPLDYDTGYRMGARFEATKWSADAVLRLARER
jgi:hypothetical protein